MPTQVTILSLAINSYTLLIAFTTIASIAVTLWFACRSVEAVSRALTGLLIIAVAALVAGRIGYVLLHIDYFTEHLAEIVSATSPGYCEQTAIAGGVIGWLIAMRTHRPIAATALVVMAALIGIGASMGCIPNSCAYGREVFWTDGWIWQIRADWPDAYTLSNPRLPTQIFMIVWLVLSLLIIGVVLFRHSGKMSRTDTPILAVWTLWFALGDFLIQFLRADVQPIFGMLRATQWADMLLFAASALWLIVVQIRKPTNR